MKLTVIIAFTLSILVSSIALPAKAQNNCSPQPSNSNDVQVRSGSISNRWRYVVYRVSNTSFYIIWWAQHESCSMYSSSSFSSAGAAVDYFVQWTEKQSASF